MNFKGVEGEPLGIKAPLLPPKALGQSVPALQFMTPLGANSLTVLDGSLFSSDRLIQRTELSPSFDNSPFFERPLSQTRAQGISVQKLPSQSIPVQKAPDQGLSSQRESLQQTAAQREVLQVENTSDPPAAPSKRFNTPQSSHTPPPQKNSNIKAPEVLSENNSVTSERMVDQLFDIQTAATENKSATSPDINSRPITPFTIEPLPTTEPPTIESSITEPLPAIEPPTIKPLLTTKPSTLQRPADPISDEIAPLRQSSAFQSQSPQFVGETSPSVQQSLAHQAPTPQSLTPQLPSQQTAQQPSNAVPIPPSDSQSPTASSDAAIIQSKQTAPQSTSEESTIVLPPQPSNAIPAITPDFSDDSQRSEPQNDASNDAFNVPNRTLPNTAIIQPKPTEPTLHTAHTALTDPVEPPYIDGTAIDNNRTGNDVKVIQKQAMTTSAKTSYLSVQGIEANAEIAQLKATESDTVEDNTTTEKVAIEDSAIEGSVVEESTIEGSVVEINTFENTTLEKSTPSNSTVAPSTNPQRLQTQRSEAVNDSVLQKSALTNTQSAPQPQIASPEASIIQRRASKAPATVSSPDDLQTAEITKAAKITKAAEVAKPNGSHSVEELTLADSQTISDLQDSPFSQRISSASALIQPFKTESQKAAQSALLLPQVLQPLSAIAPLTVHKPLTPPPIESPKALSQSSSTTSAEPISRQPPSIQTQTATVEASEPEIKTLDSWHNITDLLTQTKTAPDSGASVIASSRHTPSRHTPPYTIQPKLATSPSSQPDLTPSSTTSSTTPAALAAAPESPAADPAVEQSSSADTKTSSAQMEQLAQAVYQQVRQRLILEKERSGRSPSDRLM